MMNVIAVIVTNNRLGLLKEAVDGVRCQIRPVSTIIVVNNASNDGTAEWLDTQTDLYVIHQENSGGSGGFFTGIKTAAALHADWVWVMDDDTICRPDSLQILTNKVIDFDVKVGFIGSKCIWNDGNPHLMNLPAIMPTFNKCIPFNKYDVRGLLLTETSSFVSLLISMEAIKLVGLPYKDFFIWGDDQEYTRRITKNGYLGFYCIDSIVHHKTGVNYFPDFYRDTVSNLWKHSFGFRNEFLMVKKNKGVIYFSFWLPIKLLYTSVRLIQIRKDNKLKFIGVLLKSGWRSIFFNPKIIDV